jgi:cation:H+ antiporter
MIWIKFAICSTALTFFAYRLCKEGIILSQKTTISQGFIGMVFLAAATSFPEIATAVTSVFFLGKIGLGYGDIIGSIIVNSMILVGLDYFSGTGRMIPRLSRANARTNLYLICALMLIIISAIIRSRFPSMFSLGPLGLESIFVILVYIIAMKTIKEAEADEEDMPQGSAQAGFFAIWGKFAGLLVIVMVLGGFMARIGEGIILETGMSETFTGTLFLGFATSLPEIIVSFAALRAGALNMAVGNILGSNLFDAAVIPILDLCTAKPILSLLTLGQVYITGIALLMAVVFAIGHYWIKKQTKFKFSPDTLIIFLIGISGFVIIYYVK